MHRYDSGRTKRVQCVENLLNTLEKANIILMLRVSPQTMVEEKVMQHAVLSLLALLVLQFTCFTSTLVQMLALRTRRMTLPIRAIKVTSSIVQTLTLRTGSVVQILTLSTRKIAFDQSAGVLDILVPLLDRYFSACFTNSDAEDA